MDPKDEIDLVNFLRIGFYYFVGYLLCYWTFGPGRGGYWRRGGAWG